MTQQRYMSQSGLTDPISSGTETDWPAFGAKAAVVLIAVVTLVLLSAFFDARLASAALGLPPWFVQVGRFVSDLGTSGYMFAISGLIALSGLGVRYLLRARALDPALTVLTERAIYIFATLAASGIGAQLVKHLVGRARPTLMQTLGPYHFDLLSMKSSLASFPSGHSATAFSMAVALGLLLPRWRWLLLVLAGVIAASRIVVEAHYMSDVVAGSALGIGAALLVARLFADWSLAFERRGSSLCLKGQGVISEAALSTMRR